MPPALTELPERSTLSLAPVLPLSWGKWRTPEPRKWQIFFVRSAIAFVPSALFRFISQKLRSECASAFGLIFELERDMNTRARYA
jgi:hypothetical protein